jgi:hypothetical protein
MSNGEVRIENCEGRSCFRRIFPRPELAAFYGFEFSLAFGALALGIYF